MVDRNHGETDQNGPTNQTATPNSRLGRRSYVKLLGAAAGAALGAGTAASQSSEYDVVTVPAHSTHQIDLGDGDTLENVLIDQTAEGAKAYIRAFGSDWTIRNVGVKGKVTGRDGERGKILFVDVSAGSSALIENLYIGDGATPGTGLTGLLVEDTHAGTLTLRNVNVGKWSDNGFYTSPPGEQDGDGMGEVHIESCYGHDNNIASFRIGTPGSYVKDSVADHTGDIPAYVSGAVNGRGIWGKEQPGLKAINCDIVHPNGTAVVGSDRGAITLEDTRLDGGVNGAVDGSSSGTPDPTPPEGVPTTAEEAASGNAISGESGGGAEPKALANTLTVQTQESGPLVEYEFVVDGEVEKGDTAAGNDSLTVRDDGTTLVEGRTGNGYTDDYRFEGDLSDWSAAVEAEHYTVLVNGDEVDVGQSQGSDDETDDTKTPDPRELTVVSVDGGPLFEFEFTVAGDASLVTDGSGYKAETNNDGVSDNGDGTVTVTGATGNGFGDAFVVEGQILDWQAATDADNYRLILDGEEVAVEQFVDDVGDDTDEIEDDAPAPDPRELAVVSADGGPLFEYEFTVDGDASLVTDGSGYKAETNNDGVSDNGDGTVTVTGATGNGFGDAFVVEGPILDWQANTDAENYTLYVDGDEVALP